MNNIMSVLRPMLALLPMLNGKGRNDSKAMGPT